MIVSFFFKIILPDPVPIILEGEGHFALTAVKDIKVTEEFVGLGEKITKCQTGKFRADCENRKHREQVLRSCKCSPASMRSYYGNSVRRQIFMHEHIMIYHYDVLDQDLLHH